jgi:hypothetical protein
MDGADGTREVSMTLDKESDAFDERYVYVEREVKGKSLD